MVGELAAAYPENSSCASHLIDRVVFMRLRSIRIDDDTRLRGAAQLVYLMGMLEWKEVVYYIRWSRGFEATAQTYAMPKLWVSHRVKKLSPATKSHRTEGIY